MDKVYHPAALVSAAAYYLLGWTWYGVIFNRGPVPSIYGYDPVPYIVAAVTSLALAYVTAIVLNAAGNRTALHGAILGLTVGVGLVASTMLEQYLFEGRPVTLWLINAGYVVVGLTMIGAIVGGWQPKEV